MATSSARRMCLCLACQGLRVILGVRPSTFNTMVPRLLKPPLTSSHISAVGSLAQVAGACDCDTLSDTVHRWNVACNMLLPLCSCLCLLWRLESRGGVY